MNTTVVFIALSLLIIAGYTVFISGLVTIDNKVSKVQKTINEFYEINKKLGEVNDTLISLGKEENKISFDLNENIKEVIALNTELIEFIKKRLI